ncbi:hypothetical protein vseg_000015 [Gypsophila vaccaria]
MGDSSPSSLKHRLKHSLYGCFKTNNPNPHHPLDSDSWSSHCGRRLVRSSSSSSSSSSSGGGARGMVRHLMNRIGNGTPRQHRRSKSTDFHYDPQSYTLNFEDEFPFRNFSDRLPPSPPHLPRPRSHTCVPNLPPSSPTCITPAFP